MAIATNKIAAASSNVFVRIFFCAMTMLAATINTVRADEDLNTPAFIRMYGEWESIGVKAEPVSVFDAMPELAQWHNIIGKPTIVAPGIHFLVEQMVAGELVTTEITYIYDAQAQKSFGVIAGSNGSRLRGVIDHGLDEDILKLYNSDGDVIWAESQKWISGDVFESVGTFEFNGASAKVWFMTRRKTN